MKKQLLSLSFAILLHSLPPFGQAPIKLIQLDSNKLPFDLKLEGKVKNAVRWTDRLGNNMVIMTETGIFQNKKFKHEEDGKDAELFAYHFLISKVETKQTWKV